MTPLRLALLWLAAVNLVAAVLFLYDKMAARRGHERVPEKTLHILELLGGAFVMIPLMQIAHHKRQKRSYYLRTYAIFALWIIAAALIFLMR